ncbi:copper transport protein [Sinorhizobium fredii]|uniref:Copper binding protein n=1 Tax=Sinorhizobium fredii (strain USDA 257) TaxID=1185652 RepID=I3X978_SINF2|nr:copper resistance CopC/CopD family protein [Sinorhizobium fredii]AFL52434.1 copper binding protein [Sinorhizobium fredii USDA 257]
MTAAPKMRLNESWSRLARVLAFSVLAFSAWFWLAVAAFAHASFVGSNPAGDAVVAEAPATFSLTFSEPVSPLSLRLVKPDGSSFGLERFVLRDRTLEIELPPSLVRGTHVLSWRVVSEDGHPVGGSVVFSIGAPSTTPAASTVKIERDVGTAIWLAKIALYLGLFLGIGGSFAVTWLGRGERSGSFAILVLLGIALVATPLSVGFQGIDALDVPFRRLLDLAIWQAGMSTSFGRTSVVAALAFLSAICALAAKADRGRLLSLIALVGTGLALALSGHASSADPQWLTRPMVFLHGVGIAFWTGALIPLAQALARRTPESGEMLRRFSRTIPFLLAFLIVAGVVLSVIQVRKPAALIETAYGQVLLVKLALLVLLFALAAFNRWRLTEPAAHRDPATTRRLAGFIAVETVVVVLIVGVAAIWRFTPPPRALEIGAVEPTAIHLHSARAMANVQLSPGRAGQVAGSIEVFSKDRQVLTPKEVTLVLSNPSSGIQAIRRSAQRTGEAKWRVDGVAVPLPGTWQVRLDILVSDFELVKLEGKAEIRP